MKRLRLQAILACGLALMLYIANVSLGVGIIPANDNSSSAQPIAEVTDLTFDTTNATDDGPDHCMNGPNIWYCYTASCTGEVIISLAGSRFDTILAVYRGCNSSLDIQMIECNDDFGRSRQSQITFDAIAGNHYLIEIGGYASETGEGLLNISCGGVQPPPSSVDECENAQSIGDVSNLEFDTTEATFDGPGLCMNSPNIWYCYTATCTGEATVSLAGSSYDTMLAVYNGCECDPTQNDLIECNDDSDNTYQSKITFAVTAGNQYLIEIGGYTSDTGEGLLSISCEGVQPPPSLNDNCENAQPIGDENDLQFDTTETTFDGPGLCMNSPNIWYCYTASCTGEATVSLAGSSYDTMLAVYNGCECYPAQNDLIECNDDAGNTYQSEITFSVIAGKQYMIEIGGYASETGEGVLNISCEGVQPPPSSKDDCENAQPVGDVTNQQFKTTEATFDGPGYCMTSPNIWYCYTATCTGDVTVSLAGSSYDTMLTVYDGCECYPAQEDLIGCNDDIGNTYQSEITFAATSGSQYLIEIGGYASETGEGLLTISCEGIVVPNKPDLGDAPDSTNNFGAAMMAYPSQGLLPVVVQAHYPTVYNDGSGTGPYGPVHINAQTKAFLGKKITRETEADTGIDEDGANNIRPSADRPNMDQGDDGVIFPINMPSCRFTTIDYIVNVIVPNTDLWVNVWLDWNRDGDWDDTLDCPEGPVPEWAVQNQFLLNLPAGSNQITTPGFLTWHHEGVNQEIWMRITLSGQPYRGGSNPGAKGNAGSGPVGKYEIGETEDYLFTPDVSIPLCQDYNGDGVTDLNDLGDLVADWLQNCP
jgi:propanediol dehydratase small subunit